MMEDWKFIVLVGVISAIIPLIIRMIIVVLYKNNGVIGLFKTIYLKLTNSKMDSFQKSSCDRVLRDMFSRGASMSLVGDNLSLDIKLGDNYVDINVTGIKPVDRRCAIPSVNGFKSFFIEISSDFRTYIEQENTKFIKFHTASLGKSSKISFENKKSAVSYVEDLLSVFGKINEKSHKTINILSEILGDDITKLQYCSYCREFHDRSMFDNYKSTVCIENMGKSIICKSCGNPIQIAGRNFDNKKIIYCSSCIKKHKGNGTFYDYSSTPDLKFMKEDGDKGRFYGTEIEIEVTRGGNSRKDIADIIDRFSEHIYFKNDGSLSNGVEIITHPCTIGYHRNNTCQILEMTKMIGGFADNNNTCGLHFHVGRNYLSSMSIGMLLYMFDYYWDDLVKLSRRSQSGLRWCKRPSRPNGVGVEETYDRSMLGTTIKKEKVKVKNTAIEYYNSNVDNERYRAVNLCPSATVEFRLFDGTLNPVYFLGSMQLCDELINIALRNKDFTKYTLKELLYGKHEELDLMIDKLL